jgi:hypothetical protein
MARLVDGANLPLLTELDLSVGGVVALTISSPMAAPQ